MPASGSPPGPSDSCWLLPCPSGAQLLGELLLDRANMAVMLRYISEKDNLKLIMTLLKASDPHPAQCQPLKPHTLLTASATIPTPCSLPAPRALLTARPPHHAHNSKALALPLSSTPLAVASRGLPAALPSCTILHLPLLCFHPPQGVGEGTQGGSQCVLSALVQDPSKSIQYEAFHIFKVGTSATLPPAGTSQACPTHARFQKWQVTGMRSQVQMWEVSAPGAGGLSPQVREVSAPRGTARIGPWGWGLQVFVANPKRPEDVSKLLRRNQFKLLKFLHDFDIGKGKCHCRPVQAGALSGGQSQLRKVPDVSNKSGQVGSPSQLSACLARLLTLALASGPALMQRRRNSRRRKKCSLES